MHTEQLAIRDLIMQWQQASATGDVDSLLNLMEDDVVFLVAGSAPMRGRQQFAHTLRAVLNTHSISSQSDIQEIEIADDLAYSWSWLKVDITPKNPEQGGKTIRRSGHVLTVWRRQTDDSWRIYRDANMLGLEA